MKVKKVKIVTLLSKEMAFLLGFGFRSMSDLRGLAKKVYRSRTVTGTLIGTFLRLFSSYSAIKVLQNE